MSSRKKEFSLEEFEKILRAPIDEWSLIEITYDNCGYGDIVRNIYIVHDSSDIVFNFFQSVDIYLTDDVDDFKLLDDDSLLIEEKSLQIGTVLTDYGYDGIRLEDGTLVTMITYTNGFFFVNGEVFSEINPYCNCIELLIRDYFKGYADRMTKKYIKSC